MFLFRGQGEDGADGEVLAFAKGDDVALVTKKRKFVTIMKGGTSNMRYQNGRRVE